MRRAKRIVWILNGLLLTVLILIGCLTLIENSNELRTEGGRQSAESTPYIQQYENSGEMVLAIGGDVLINDYHEENYDKNGATGVVSNDVQAILRDADAVMLNEEFPLCSDGEKDAKEEKVYRVPPAYASLLKEIRVDIVSLANDHILDYGTDGLLESCSTLDEQGIKYTGAGETIDRAKEIQYVEKDGYKIGIVAASRVIPDDTWNATENEAGIFSAYDTDQLTEAITEAKEYADYVVVYLHWGVKYKTKPESDQRELAKQLIDAGADAIVGSNSHCLQGIEYYNDCPIVYSLGDFLYEKTLQRTAVVTLSVGAKKTCELRIYPCFIKDAKTCLITKKSSVADFYEYIESISYGISIDTEGIVTVQEE